MKLWRFSAANMQIAMMDISRKLGPDAMIYTTRQVTGGGVEVVAGLPVEEQVENTPQDTSRSVATEMKREVSSVTACEEFIDQSQFCALVGPTGVGKTTTIAKLAKRFISRYGNKPLGLITTDFNDVARKNHLHYYSQAFGVDLEYANNEIELESAIHTLRNKKLVLIDTHGASQRDHGNVGKLLALLASQGDKIATYLTLPCNAQEPIMEEVARAFISTSTKGVILTKQDESITIAPAVSVSMNYDLPINYICSGQNINSDIHSADPQSILRQIIQEGNALRETTESRLFQKMDHVTQKLKEGNYDRQGTF